MLNDPYIQAAFLGLIEGLTEFLPVSSTGHLILFGDMLQFVSPAGKSFEVIIQLGAILAVCVTYFGRLWRVLIALPTSKEARHFAVVVFVGFLPAMIVGALAHSFIKSVLFSPLVVSVALTLGGVVILVIEGMFPEPEYMEVEQLPTSLAIKIGFFQCVAMIPGVSRSGATIIGALLMRVERRAAAEYSFFLAIPTMFGATAYELYKGWSSMSSQGSVLIMIGFVVAFVSAILVVRTMIGFITRYGFTPFGWYRIVLGSSMLAYLYL
ncbi:Undecaprenyl-diphosphatase 1 [Azospirillaceae bacterium]